MDLSDNKILVSANDAGAAEYLVLIINELYPKNTFDFHLTGPARSIFAREGLKNKNIKKEIIKINSYDLCLLGTSLDCDTESEIIKTCKTNKIYTISILDHWVNYKERFLYKKKLLLPEEIWVFDEYAKNLAKSVLNFKNIKVKKNYLILNKIKSYKEIPEYKPKHILYLTENIPPIKNVVIGQKFDDSTALGFFLKNKKICEDALNLSDIKNILIRPHPSQKQFNIDLYKKKYLDYNFEINNSENLLKQIKQSHYIVGVDTMAMVIAVELGKRVFSSVPLEYKNDLFNLLPYEESITKISDLQTYLKSSIK